MALVNRFATGLAIDSQALAKLKLDANKAPDQALTGAAKQFESVFTSMLMKSMRATLPKEGLLDNEASELYTGMLDQQLAQKMSEKGIGLADMMVKQLSRTRAAAAPDSIKSPPTSLDHDASTKSAHRVEVKPSVRMHKSDASILAHPEPQAFVQRLWSEAVSAQQATGVPAKFMIGQAALESGWGKREIRGADGTTSFNLFAIKAGKNWNGKMVDVATTEYVNGVPQRVTQKFRAYSSYAEAFGDYAKLLTTNPRYSGTLQHASDPARFASSLQHAGYATDPHYAQKLTAVINHKALRLYTA